MKTIRPFSNFTFHILKLLVRPVAFFLWKYHTKSIYKISKGESVVVLSNHQTDYDPILIHLSFNRLLRTVATDNIFKKGISNWFIRKMGGIPKRKGIVDVKCNTELIELASKGESLLLFPEGNRCYADFQYYISDNVAKMIKRFHATLILFNIHGGFGRYPRWGNKPRKGKFYGEIVRTIPYSEYKDMDDIELGKLVVSSIKVFDSESHELYKSKRNAEYLERMFFACPVCGQHSKLVSKGNVLKCTNCGLEVKYNEDLSLSSDNPRFPYKKLVEWYNYQKKWVREFHINKDKAIFLDEDVTLKTAEPFEKSKLLYKGSMSLFLEKLIFNDECSFAVKDISIASPVSKRKLVFTYQNKEYEVRGKERFNALKYVLMFNKIKDDNSDRYYSLMEEK